MRRWGRENQLEGCINLAGSHLGRELDLIAEYKHNRHVTYGFGLAHLFTGRFLNEATQGKDYKRTEERAAIIGGFVARGDGLSQLTSKYVFGDYGSGVGAPAPNGHILGLFGNEIESLQIAGRPDGLGLSVLGFAIDAHGDIYR